MGADLYIDSVYEPNHDKYKKLFDKAVSIRDAFPVGSKQAKEAQVKVDLYFEKMNEKGYFRDSYNGSSLFWRLGLSWWKDWKTNKKGEMSVAKCKKWLKTIEGIKLISITFDELKNSGCLVEKSGENSVDVWNKYFVDKKNKFEEFLKLAISLNEPIYSSC